MSATGAVLENKLPFRLSGNLLKQNGILKTGDFQRQALGLNLSPKFLNNTLSVDFNLKAVRTTNRFADEGAIGSAIGFDPTQPVRVNSDRFGGYYEYLETIGVGVVPRDLAPRNPVALLNMRENNSEVRRVLGNIQFNYQIPFIKGLRANLNLGRDWQDGQGTNIMSDSAASAYRSFVIGRNRADTRDSVLQYGGFRNGYKSKTRNNLLDAYLNYTTDIKSINSRIEVMGGYGYQDFNFTSYNIPGRFFSDAVNPLAANNLPPSQDDGYTLISYYGRFVYTLADRYVFKFDARTDGISKYNPAWTLGLFPGCIVCLAHKGRGLPERIQCYL
jgi:iron complex outermembrane receptor protein